MCVCVCVYHCVSVSVHACINAGSVNVHHVQFSILCTYSLYALTGSQIHTKAQSANLPYLVCVHTHTHTHTHAYTHIHAPAHTHSQTKRSNYAQMTHIQVQKQKRVNYFLWVLHTSCTNHIWRMIFVMYAAAGSTIFKLKWTRLTHTHSPHTHTHSPPTHTQSPPTPTHT